MADHDSRGAAGTEGVALELRRRVLRVFGRSLHVRTVDTGSCAVCESEIRLLAAPHYDLHRLGFFFTPAPRHADLLMVTGPAIRAADNLLLKAFEATPDPKAVIAVGACALGGVYPQDELVHGAVDRVLPVDVYVPGCPPSPLALLQGLLVAVGRLEERVAALSLDLDGGELRMTHAIGVLAACAAGVWFAAAIAGLAATRIVGLRASAALSGVGGAACATCGVLLAVHGSGTTLQLGTGPIGGATFHIEPLAAPFVVLLGVVGVAIALYGPRYHEPSQGTAVYFMVYNLALVASLAVLLAGNVVAFLVAWESMALLCYAMILRHHRREGVAGGAFLFIAMSEIGFLLIMLAFAILASRTGTLDLVEMARRSARVPIGWRSAVFLLALFGFGFKAGLVPFHVWLPAAHPVAPADGSAFLSGMVIKLGVYGIALFGVTLLHNGPAWWGLVTMGLGAISAVLGILYALMERDLKRFLAFSSVENIGIVVTALGAGMTFTAYGQRAIGAFLLIVALYHAVNHGVYKTLLFLEAGVIEHATGTRDLDRLGGLIRGLPRTAVISLVGTLAIAALPPLNGFVSEWLLFQGLFQGFRIGNDTVGILIVIAGALIALTSGLAINAFARAYGIPFLGMPRSGQAAHARETRQPLAGPSLLAGACVFLGLGAPLVLTALDRVARSASGVDIQSKLVLPRLTVIPAHTDFSGFSPTYLAACLLAMLLVPIVIYLAGRPRARSRRAPVWDGGIVAFKARMQYTATTYANPVRVTFAPLYQPHIHLERSSDDPAGRSGPVHYRFRVTPIFDRYLYRPLVRLVERVATAVRPIQNGDVNLYLLYVFVVVLIAYAVYAS